MIQALKSKKVSSKFQILVEVAEHQPTIRQKDIAAKMDITPQAVSEYVKEMVEEGLIHTDGKKMYVVTREGVNFVLAVGKEMEEYLDHINNIVTNISVWAAVADEDLREGDQVSLFMEDGILHASKGEREGFAHATVVTSAKAGKDVGISDISGIISLEVGKVTICPIPQVQDGGSKCISSDALRKAVEGADIVCAIGIEAFVALSEIDVTSQINYGVKSVVVEAARRGISPVIVCVESELPSLLKRLGEDAIGYEFVDIKR
ncbi:MAG: DUF7839 domain-containing protein [Candidatus Syntropharchaeales archaeon]|nr:winged helix-turn-helix transcriptional regulator [Candidatus Syntrophoarchaeum sp.]